MLVLNELVNDGRVIRSAQFLNQHAKVTVVGLARGRIQVNESQVSKSMGLEVQFARLPKKKEEQKNFLNLLIRYRRAAVEMVKIAISTNPDIIHAHDCYTLWIAKYVARKTGARLVYDAHELYRESSHRLKGVLGFLRNYIENWALKNADQIIACNSDRAKIMVEEYGAHIFPAIVINTVTFQSFENKTYLKDRFAQIDSPVKRILIYHGLVSPARCIEELIEALYILSDHTVGLAIVGIGTKKYMRLLQNKISDFGLDKQILIADQVSQRELHGITCSADAGIVFYRPDCRNNYLCASNKLMEYAMAGIPIIGSNLPQIRDFIDKYGCGLYVDPLSKDELANALYKMLILGDDFVRLKKNTAKAAKAECWENHSNSLLQAYKDKDLL